MTLDGRGDGLLPHSSNIGGHDPCVSGGAARRNVAQRLPHPLLKSRAAHVERSCPLQRNRTKSLDAPSWLWNSVVDLVAAHEAAYLHHCRRYAIVEAS